LWDQCQNVRARRGHKIYSRKTTRRIYLVNGIVKCFHCGRGLRAQSADHIRYYREASRDNGFDDCQALGRSIHADLIDGQVEQLMLALRLPENWEISLDHMLRSAHDGDVFNPDAERKRLRDDLRELRELKRRKLYDGEEHLFWREVEAIQEKLAKLDQAQTSNVHQAAHFLNTIPAAWAHATQEERRELVQMLLAEVGCDLLEKRIRWIKPNSGFETLFHLITSNVVQGCFDICDIWESKS
jgi:hypothetical protein